MIPIVVLHLGDAAARETSLKAIRLALSSPALMPLRLDCSERSCENSVFYDFMKEVGELVGRTSAWRVSEASAEGSIILEPSN